MLQRSIRRFRASMKSMLRRRYSRYVTASCGTAAVLKSSNGMKNATERSSLTRSCRRKKSTSPTEAFKQRKEVVVLRQCLIERAVLPFVVSPDALEREVQPV